MPMEDTQIRLDSQCGGPLLDEPFYFEWGTSMKNVAESKCLWTIPKAADGYITLIGRLDIGKSESESRRCISSSCLLRK